MRYTTQSDNPVIADFSNDGVTLECTYTMYNSDLKKSIITDKMFLTYDELEQVFNAYKQFKREIR